nr:helicase associated domain-containing protein [Streptomyces sp. 3211]
MPYEHVETTGAFPLGRWLSDQQREYRAWTMTSERAAELGIVWDTADAGFETNLGAARAYYELHGTPAAPRHATARAVADQHPPPRGLGKTPYARSNRPAALAAIDPDWNPGPLGWTVDWQRHYTYLAQHLAEGARLTAVGPGTPRHGDGRRTVVRHPQRRNWNQLNTEQQRRLGDLGVTEAPRAGSARQRRLRRPSRPRAARRSRRAWRPSSSTSHGKTNCRDGPPSSRCPTAPHTG